MEDSRFDFFQWLKDVMDEKGWGCRQLADRSGVSECTIHYYLRGDRYPTLYTFLLMLDALDKHLSIDDN